MRRSGTSEEANKRNDEELRIVMVGKTGIGKSSTGNTILGRRCFESKFSPTSITDECSKAKAEVDGQKVSVIDTPGLFDTRWTQDKTHEDIKQCISYSSPGPHVFLVVVGLGRFTEEEKQSVEKIREMFGQVADKYSMVLFTHGDRCEEPEKKLRAEYEEKIKNLTEKLQDEIEEARREIKRLQDYITYLKRGNSSMKLLVTFEKDIEDSVECETRRMVEEERKEEMKREMIQQLKAENERDLKEQIKHLEEMYKRKTRENAEKKDRCTIS